MATTDMNDDEKAYLDAFNEDAPAAAGPTEDAEFGTEEAVEPAAELPAEPVESKDTDVMAEDAGNANDGEDASVTMVVDGGELEAAADAAGAKDSAEAAADMEPVVAVEDEAAPKSVDMDKEIQRLKSWEGRLKAMEAKLKAAGADTPEEQTEAVAEAIEQAADTTDTPADEEKVEQIADQVEEGSISPEQAMKQLAEDFGDDFVRMIEAIATAKAREAGGQAAADKVGELKGTVDEIIGDIVDSKAKAHFERIAEAHPDFSEIGESEEFKTYIESLPDDQKGPALETIAGGSAKSIIKLIDGFKAANKAGGDATPELTEAKESIVDEVSDDMLDAAEGVRSSGMKLPEQPQKSDDYAAAWDQF